MRRLMSLGALALAVLAGSSAFAADAAKGSIAGKVVDADGKAVAEAKVVVMNPADVPGRGGAGGGRGAARQAEEPKAGAKPEVPGGRVNLEEKAVAKGVTGADGTYTIADVPAGKYVVISMATGKGRGRANVEVTAGQETKVEDIKLQMRGPGPRGPGGGGKAPAEGTK